MNTRWVVDPNEEWEQKNMEWLLQSNLPGTERCAATIGHGGLPTFRCELVAAHDCEHMVHMNDGPETPPAD